MKQAIAMPLKLSIVATTLLLGACTIMPSGPNVMVLPGTGQSTERFRADDYVCRDFALGQIGGRTSQQAANQAALVVLRLVRRLARWPAQQSVVAKAQQSVPARVC